MLNLLREEKSSDNQVSHCYLTIYSRYREVVEDIADAYLGISDQSLKKLTKDRSLGMHCIYISQTLALASQKLIALKKSGELANTDGAACHLFVTITAEMLEELILNKQDFRQYVQPLDGFCAPHARTEQNECISLRAS